jgi:NAD(P)-dependent dehydrogenase (short-subunit alcohol dehydrogenase family)
MYMNKKGKTILVTGGAHRIGRQLCLSAAEAGFDVILHYHSSDEEARKTAEALADYGVKTWLIRANLSIPAQVSNLLENAWNISPIFALVNNAAIFTSHRLEDTDLNIWQKHLDINLTAPYLLSRAFSRLLPSDHDGRIINILDWRALRPKDDHFPYTISKAALAALTKSLATALAPRITVNGLALGAILPPADMQKTDKIIEDVPAQRWGDLKELKEAFLFLLEGPAYITGEIIHLDGGRHLV